MLKKTYAIANDIDAPNLRGVVKLVGETEHTYKFEYITKEWSVIEVPKNIPTFVEDFGVRIVFHKNGNISKVYNGDSSATYSDGVPRMWQGRDGESCKLLDKYKGEWKLNLKTKA